MTNKAQATLTIALTAAVTVLMVDRMIEPAQALSCIDEGVFYMELKNTENNVVRRVHNCFAGAQIDDDNLIMPSIMCLEQ